VHNLQNQLNPFDPSFLFYFQQYLSGTSSTEDAARVFVYPPLDLQSIFLRYAGEVCPYTRIDGQKTVVNRKGKGQKQWGKKDKEGHAAAAIR